MSERDDDRAYMTPTEVAALLQMPLATLTAWRYHRTGPPYVRMGRHVRYPRDDVTRWAESLTVEPAGRGA